MLQRRLAKKLGLKSRRDALGGDDGLDDLLDGLDDGLDSAEEVNRFPGRQRLCGPLSLRTKPERK